MRVFVAGATGVIGRRLIPMLVDEGRAWLQQAIAGPDYHEIVVACRFEVDNGEDAYSDLTAGWRE